LIQEAYLTKTDNTNEEMDIEESMEYTGPVLGGSSPTLDQDYETQEGETLVVN